MELVFAYGAGLLTLINPCVLPILPIVLAASVQNNRLGPLALAAGMSVSFVVLGLFISTIGYGIGLSEEVVNQGAAVLMILFGLTLLIPQFGGVFARATNGLAMRADAGIDGLEQQDLRGQFMGGVLMGAVWSPCIGPTLGGAIALASQGQSLAWAGLIMVFFALGVSSIILALAYGARSAIMKRQALMRRLAQSSRPVMGAVFVAVGLGILFEVQKLLEFWAIENMPQWMIDLSVAL